MKLGVNIDHVATLRQARRGIHPRPVDAAAICEKSGADSIVVHLREDRRHINDADVALLQSTIKTKLNLEMSIAPAIVAIACRLRPDQVTLVPEKRKELTTEGGLDVIKELARIRKTVSHFKDQGIPVSLFIDPRKQQIDAAIKSGARIIELHTGGYAQARTLTQRSRHLKDIVTAVAYARSMNLIVNAGHGLDYTNVKSIAVIKGINELNIGYSIICRALIVGLARSVSEMKARI